MSDVPAPSGPAAPPPAAPGSAEATSASGFFQAVHAQRPHIEAAPRGKRLAFLSLAALGVVYGDIGTSPLYALRQCLNGEYPVATTIANVYGVLSLIVWSLILVVSVKYIVFIMRADNRGEGGILALLALLLQQERRDSDTRRRGVLIALGLFGAALLYGDGVITPAISVLGAVEGLKVVAPEIPTAAIVISTLVILIALFSLQRFGTARVGYLFGPIMTVWFVSIGALGLVEIVREPRIVAALYPLYGLQFLLSHGTTGFLVLGAVVLAVTGAEALYADMGHFGKRPIRLAWFSMVLPALLLNYFGQGALILRNPAAAESPFYLLAPRFLVVPLLIIATLAAIVASQALISGAFSLMQQSVQLGYSPRVTIIHTSKEEAGQIFVPEVNTILMIGCLVLVVAFRDSGSLSAAYGIAVTGTMAITSLLYYVVSRQRWGWPLWQSLALTAAFLIIDVAFFAANIIKVEHGGWVPLAMATGIFILMSTWKRGRLMLHGALNEGQLPLPLFLDDIGRNKPTRVPGTAVFMSSVSDGVPVVLLHHLKHNKVLHEQVILMSIVTTEVPEVPPAERVRVEAMAHGFWRIIARYGFMESPDVGDILHRARAATGLKAKPAHTTFYLGRERIIVRRRGQPAPSGVRSTANATKPLRMARWRKKIFVIMSRNARSATEFFGIPPNRVVELGAQVEL